MKQDIGQYKDDELCKLIDNRWSSSAELWEIVDKTYKINTAIYENRAEWLSFIPERRRRYTVQANRIFVNMEAVINSLIAQPAGINIIPAREGVEAQDFAAHLESYFRKKYQDLNVKETIRMALRNLYFSRLLVLKPYWNPAINDFDVLAVDPRKIRVAKYARKEQDSEFAIEEIEDNLCSVVQRFPDKKEELMKEFGVDEAQLYIKNPDIKYKEAWIGDYVIFKYKNIILDKIKNPYWDWDGILVTEEEEGQLNETSEEKGLDTNARRELMTSIKLQQDQRKAEMEQKQLGMQSVDDSQEPYNASTEEAGEDGEDSTRQYQYPTGGATGDYEDNNAGNYKPYFFNYFDAPRKPYIIATIFNN